MGKQVDNLFVYGDSYSDINSKTRRTNGPLWSQQLAALWNTELKSYASTGSHSCYNEKSSLYLARQVELAKQSIPSTSQNNVHAVFIGVTDLSDTQDKTTTKALIECIKKQILEIHRLDPEGQFILLGPPPIEYSPYFLNHEKQSAVKQRTAEFNVGLEDAVTDWRTESSIKVEFIDLYVLFGTVLGDPAEYQIQDVEQAYWDVCQGTCSEPMNKYLWWDNIHMTGAGHLTIANEIASKNPFGITPAKTISPAQLPANGQAFVDQTGGSIFSGVELHFASWLLFLVLCVLLLLFLRPAKMLGLLKGCFKTRKAHKKEGYSIV